MFRVSGQLLKVKKLRSIAGFQSTFICFTDGFDRAMSTESRTKSSGARLFDLTRPQASLLGGAFATLSLTSSVTLSFPYLTGKIIDSQPEVVDPKMAAAGLFSLICIAGGGVIARQILLTKAGEKIVAALRTRLFENILRQEAEFFDKTRTGDLVTRLTADVQLVHGHGLPRVRDARRRGGVHGGA